MALMPVSPYRRHLSSCPHKSKGQHYTLCNCPIWCYGETDASKPVRCSLRTNDWNRGQRRAELLQKGQTEVFLPEGKGSGLTLHDAIEAYRADAAARHLATSTLDLGRHLFVHMERDLGADTLLASITVPMLDLFRQSRVRKLPNGETRPIKPRTQGKEIRMMRTFFGWCVDRDWMAKNPAKKLRLPVDDELATLPFDNNEVTKLILACDQLTSDNPAEIAYIRHRARALVYALLYTGLRISDVAKLERAKFDPQSRYLTLRIMKTRAPLRVLLHGDATKTLETLPATNPQFFFWTGNGSLNTLRKNLDRTIRRLGKLAGVQARAHRFRDTFAVELLTQGADIRTVQLLLGHKSVKTTEKHYAHFVAAHQALLDSATAKLDFSPQRRLVAVKPLRNRRRNA
jgi:site-specific recombinase XerD